MVIRHSINVADYTVVQEQFNAYVFHRLNATMVAVIEVSLRWKLRDDLNDALFSIHSATAEDITELTDMKNYRMRN